jgi:hypothetical protein
MFNCVLLTDEKRNRKQKNGDENDQAIFPELEQSCLQHFWNCAVCLYHGRMKYKDTCRLSFNIDLFCGMCLTYFIDWRYIHSWLVFSTQLVNCCPHGRRNYACVLLSLYHLSDLPPSLPLPKVNVHNIQTVCGCGGGGGGVELCCRQYSVGV